jgi:hypothetical protein
VTATVPNPKARAILVVEQCRMARKTKQGRAEPSFERQIALHEAGKFEPDAERAMALFHRLIVENARWDALRGVDPMERWRRDKEAQGPPPP